MKFLSSSSILYFIEKVRSLVGPKMASFVEQVYQTYDWKVPKHIVKKPSKLPAVDKPLPGTSYNPTYDDHQVKTSIFNYLFNKYFRINFRIYFEKLLMLNLKRNEKNPNY
jgi:hypothetical protein